MALSSMVHLVLEKNISKGNITKNNCKFNEGLDPQNQSLFNTDHHPDFYLLDRDKIYLKILLSKKRI